MFVMKFNKLVRDKIATERWNVKYGKNPKYRIANNEEIENVRISKLEKNRAFKKRIILENSED